VGETDVADLEVEHHIVEEIAVSVLDRGIIDWWHPARPEHDCLETR
jgi:hypothetical protein